MWRRGFFTLGVNGWRKRSGVEMRGEQGNMFDSWVFHDISFLALEEARWEDSKLWVCRLWKLSRGESWLSVLWWQLPLRPPWQILLGNLPLEAGSSLCWTARRALIILWSVKAELSSRTAPVSQQIASDALSLIVMRCILIKPCQVCLPCGITWSLT